LLRKSIVDDAFGALMTSVLSKLSAEQDRGQFYIDAASRVFTTLMDLVSDHQGLLIQQFGVLRLFEVVSLLQTKCDELFAVFFEKFLDRQVRPMVADVVNGSKKAEDLAKLGLLLDVMTKLSLRCEIFGHFIDQVNREALEYAKQTGQADANMQQQHDAIAAGLAHSLVRRGNLESMSNYAVLELHFLRLSLQRARRDPFCAAEHFETDDKTKKNLNVEEKRLDECGWVDVDAAFFVLARSCERALAGRQGAAGCAVLSGAGALAEHDLVDWLRVAWEGPASRSAPLFTMLLDRMIAASKLAEQLQLRLDQVLFCFLFFFF
jgi:hypothetical protein